MSFRTLFLVVVVLTVVGGALGVVWSRHLHRQAYIELSALEHERDELNIEFGRLQLEQATWAESNRVDQVARNRLGMVFPQADEIVVVRP